MQIMQISQAQDTESWLEARKGRITGTKAKSLALEPYAQVDVEKLTSMRDKQLEAAKKAKTDEKRMEYQTKAKKYDQTILEAEKLNKRLKVGKEFWKFLAETVAEDQTGENPLERGHRLEATNIRLTIEKIGVSIDETVFDTGMWFSDVDERISVSPDAHENAENPTWAIECKSINSASHLQTVIPWLVHEAYVRSHGSYLSDEMLDMAQAMLPAQTLDMQSTGIDFVPSEYREQVLQYFVVNPDLQVLYFSMLDDRIYDDSLAHVVIPIRREDVENLVQAQEERELKTLEYLDDIRSMFKLVAF